MKKAFFINGGAGRVLCALPALEYYIQNTDPDAIIVAEGWMELFLSSKILRNNVYSATQRDLFEILKDREIISPEPYRLNAYFNQQVNLIQAFDILINGYDEELGFPETKSFDIELGKKDEILGYNVTNEAKMYTQKDKVIVFQPFGSGAELDGNFIVDESGRSFEVEDIVGIVQKLNEEYAVILMSELKLPIQEHLGVMTPEGLNLLQWLGVINSADYFLGCDSVGQHFANALGKPATVVIGATFPQNISYPNNKKFQIIDNGNGRRQYSPIRIAQDMGIERNNERLMELEEETIQNIFNGIKGVLGRNMFQPAQYQQESSCCGSGSCSN